MLYKYARELQSVLNYKEWRRFENVINKAKKFCKNSDITVLEHFVDIDKTIKMHKGATKNIRDYKLTRYIRKTIKELGETIPEDLLTPKKSLKQLEKENKKALKKK